MKIFTIYFNDPTRLMEAEVIADGFDRPHNVFYQLSQTGEHIVVAWLMDPDSVMLITSEEYQDDPDTLNIQ